MVTAREAKSGSYEFSEQTLENVKKAAHAALQAMTVTNMTTAEEILQAVNDVITNKKIQAEVQRRKFNPLPKKLGKKIHRIKEHKRLLELYR